MTKKIIFIILIFFINTVNITKADINDTILKADNAGVNKLDNYKFAIKQINKAKKLEKKGKTDKAIKRYEKALKYLLKANSEKPVDPNILSYLGFSNQKLGNFEDAEIYYLIGLEIDSTHEGINEFLGELYVETNRISMAKERLSVLKDCNCKEFKELEAVIKNN
tara:strand:- start:121 stop:615 length:495 start_codon:yes stop_codon:yes gene_type:complete